MKMLVAALAVLLASCTTTQNADGSTQVTLHLAKLSQDLRESLLPAPPQAASNSAAAPKTVSTSVKVASPKVAISAKALKDLQDVFECREQKSNFSFDKVLYPYATSEPDSDSYTLKVPITVFGHKVSKATVFLSGEGIYRAYIPGQSLVALAKSAGLKKTKDGYVRHMDWRSLSVENYEGIYYQCSVNYERY
jgi:hypothetical protein